jgi:hypothetical protein
VTDIFSHALNVEEHAADVFNCDVIICVTEAATNNNKY